MTIHAIGSFDVQMIPQSQDEAVGSTLGRMSLAKQFHGDLDAPSKGEMLTASTSTGSAAYVAIERVTGTLHGRTGTFVLLHNGLMTPAAQHLTITVVPDSGTNQLVGIAGTLSITIVDGKHGYDFEYTLGETM